MAAQVSETALDDQRSAGAGPLLLHELFERQVDETPEALALITDERELSYWELEERANQFAHHLVEKGVKPGDLVALYASRSEVSVEAILGILKAGAGYVPIDPAFPEDRIQPTSRVEVSYDDRNLCYVIYPSGTTGKPKGVMAEHRNTVLFVHAFNEVCQVTNEDRIYHGFSLDRSFSGVAGEWIRRRDCHASEVSFYRGEGSRYQRTI